MAGEIVRREEIVCIGSNKRLHFVVYDPSQGHTITYDIATAGGVKKSYNDVELDNPNKKNDFKN